MKRSTLRVLDLAGSPAAMGDAHGTAYADEIRAYADERVRLAGSGDWSGGSLDRDGVLALAEDCIPAHEAHSPALHEEMCGMAEGAGITLAEAIVVGGFTDFVDTVRAAIGGRHPAGVVEDDCTAFVVPDARADGAGFYAQTWDMHDSATEHVVLLRVRPDDGPAALVFSTTGCLGQIGMNEAGVCVGINNLTGIDGTTGVTWPTVVRDALLRSSAAEALEVVLGADLAGAHSYLLFDADGSGYMVEGMPTARPWLRLDGEALVHTNHTIWDEATAVQAPRPADLEANSARRLERAVGLLDHYGITAEDCMAITRDPDSICRESDDTHHIESSGAVVMRPRTRDFWAVWGVPRHNDYVNVPFPD
ncbi:MAG: C45 family autoproteolytic acyltransferase/hydrolase [Acidimicrobiales bacterium]|nr:C45 family autoproteolytic acyltransferase/hydrolase [Acidimicrobiales bacterium]